MLYNNDVDLIIIIITAAGAEFLHFHIIVLTAIHQVDEEGRCWARAVHIKLEFGPMPNVIAVLPYIM